MNQLLEDTRYRISDRSLFDELYDTYNKIHDRIEILKKMKTTDRDRLIQRFGIIKYKDNISIFEQIILSESMNILVIVVDNASDEPLNERWRTYIRDEIFAKIGMRNTVFHI